MKNTNIHYNQLGRSMIEMLGVLAIIGVLSVGGIAGYSKAMMKFKLNKTINEMRHIISEITPYMEELKDIDTTTLHNVLKSLNLIPNTWRPVSNYFVDASNHKIELIIRRKRFVISLFPIFEIRQNSLAPIDICMSVYTDLVKPLDNSLYYAWLHWNRVGNDNNIESGGNMTFPYYGRQSCTSGKDCIKDLTFNKITDICKTCNNVKECAVVLEF